MTTIDRTRWLIAALGATVVLGGLLVLFRIPAPPAARPPVIKPVKSVQIAQPGPADPLLQEETEIRDLRPLFLPTRRNAALPEPRREAGRTFLDNEDLKLSYAEADLNVVRSLPPVATISGKPVTGAEAVDALATPGIGATLLGFGRQPVELSPFADRGGFVEVVATRDGRRVLVQALGPEARPPGAKAWVPLEFLAAVDAAGLVSPLVLTEGSRVEEVDAHFKNFLTRTFRVGERLPPGFYRITVAP